MAEESAVEIVGEVSAVPAASSPQPAQDTANPAPATPPEGEGKEQEKPTEQTPEKPNPRRFERRLANAYRKAAEEKAKADFLEKELERVRTVATPKDESAPTLAQFEYDPEKYARAVAEYEKGKFQKELQAKQQQESVKQYTERLTASWSEKVADAYDKYEDFDEVVGDLKPTVPFVAAIFEADNGPDIAHYLGKNPKEAQRIAQLSPGAQYREIGKLEMKLSAEPPKAVTPSKAPAPITPLTGTTPVVAEGPSENDDMKQWMAKRQKQVHGKR